MRCRSRRSLATTILLCLCLLPLLPRPLSAAPAKTEPAKAPPIAIAAESVQALIDQNGSLVQPVRLVIQREGSPIDATIHLGDAVRKELRLTTGKNELYVLVPAVKDAAEITVAVTASDNQSASQTLVLKPVRPLTVYLLPHSHVDIGYTHVQTEVEAAQWRHLEMAIEAAKKSAGNPPGARFKWNTEVLWAVDSYLKQASPEKREAFFDAVKQGWIGLDALYGNELTGLCRPEELLRLVTFAARIAKHTGVPIESAMITDVPGYTWGTVTAFNQAGVKYFSVGPNATDRIGRTTSTWGNKPFWWIAPNGRDRVLVWLTGNGYCNVFRSTKDIVAYLGEVERQAYPYSMIHTRYCTGDNGQPDVNFADQVKQWNETHVSPKLVIATTAEMFRDFERAYGDKIPSVRGDFTPYWEDGAASSARETSLARSAAERLVQAETLWAILDPAKYPADKFDAAWRNVVLYNEHTWGAYNSVSKPDIPFVKQQWAIKQAFALDADIQSRNLLASVAAAEKSPESSAVDVFNTNSWPRTDLVVLSKEQSRAGDRVVAADGSSIPSQRLYTGELAFLAKDIPPLAAKRFTIVAGEPNPQGQAKATASTLRNSIASVEVDPVSGAIVGLRTAGSDQNLVDTKSGVALNRYYYVLSDKVHEAKTSGNATITVKDNGPLVATLQIDSDAPGARQFSRQIRVVDGLDRVDIGNVIDKTPIREKEAVHLGFAFNVPGGEMRVDIPWAVIRPEVDQLPGACKNWLSVGRWVDVSNTECGVTWATLDAPLLEVGSMTANIMGPLTKPEAWLGRLEPSQTIYSWVMNNHWYTNYRADQEGPTRFRYALRPHQGYDAVAAQRFGIEVSQPLVVLPAQGSAPTGMPLLELDTPEVIVTAMKPSADGRAWIVRLFAAAGRNAEVNLRWKAMQPSAVSRSDLSETLGKAVSGPIQIPAWSAVTLRAERP